MTSEFLAMVSEEPGASNPRSCSARRGEKTMTGRRPI